MKIDCVFSGGGVKGYAFLGAYQVLQEKNYEIDRVAGTSAGAIFASLIAAGYTSSEMQELMKDLSLQKLLDPPRLGRIPLLKWISFYFQKGLYKGDNLEKWLKKTLADKGIHNFEDLPENKLKIIVSDISLGKLIVLPDDLRRVYHINPMHFSVAAAVRMSAGFPYFFIPKKVNATMNQKSYMVDGGILSNFPLWVFRKKEIDLRPVLGVTLSEDIANAEAYSIKNAFDMLHALFITMQRAHDTRYIAKSKENNVIFIPVKKVSATDLSINEEEREALIKMGKQETRQFLEKWP